jgi:isocitrate dehydrogenase
MSAAADCLALRSAPAELPAEATVAVAAGDGIGPEITGAVLSILEAGDAGVKTVPVAMGGRAWRAGASSGISPAAWEAIAAHRVLLKGPMATPQGGGIKSINVTLRKALGLFAGVRPCRALAPVVASRHPDMDLVVIRENEEDTYAGIEHRQTHEVYQCLKLISRPACERIARYAFEYAVAHGRRSVACMTKDNIMKLTDGLFHRVFDEVALEYPAIEASHHIIDIGMARVADEPERFDVILAPNLYGDILSDVAAQAAGSVGLAGSANIGEHCAVFEAVHGSAPDIAGQDRANPSGLLMAVVMMLVHLGRARSAERIHNAWLATLEDGIHTGDIRSAPHTTRMVGTRDFSKAVIERLGESPRRLAPARYGERSPAPVPAARLGDPARPARAFRGVDLFLHWDENGRSPDALARRLLPVAGDGFRLAMISNRGVKVWPAGMPQTLCTDHWRCRFLADGDGMGVAGVPGLMAQLGQAGLEVVKTENLYDFDGAPGYSLAQGQ